MNDVCLCGHDVEEHYPEDDGECEVERCACLFFESEGDDE